MSEKEENKAGIYLIQGKEKQENKDYKGAIEAFSKVIEINPNSIESFYFRAISKEKLNDYTGAEEDYTKTISIISNNPGIFYERGNVRYKLNKFVNAIEDFSKVIDIDPNYKWAYQNRGNAKCELKDFEGAIEDYSKVIEIDSNYKWAYQQRGIAKSKLENYQGAIEDFSKVIEIDPGYKWAYQQRSIAKSKLEDYKGVIEDISKVIEFDSNDRWNYFKRAESKNNLMDYLGALEDFNKAIELDPDYDWAYYGRGLANNNLKNYKEAIADLSKALQLNSNLVQAHYNLGLAKHDVKDFDGAIESYKEAISFPHDRNILFYYNLKLAKNKLESFKGAIEDIKDSQKDSNYLNAYFSRGRADRFFSNGQFDYNANIKDYNKVIEIDSKYEDAYYYRGKAKLELKDYEGAIEDFSKVIEIDQNYKWAYQERGNAKIGLKDYHGALKDLNIIIELDPDNTYYYFNRANTLVELEDYQGALKDYDKAIELDNINDEFFNSRCTLKNIIGDIKGSEIDKGLSEFYRISSEKRSDYLTEKFIELKSKQSDNGINWINDSLLAIAKMEKEEFDNFCKDENVLIRSAVAVNQYIPEELLSVLVEDSNLLIKLSVLHNVKCPETILEKASENYENYSSSRLRKAVALNVNTPFTVIKKLIKDEYRWVREAAASHQGFKNEEITNLILTADRYILKGLVANPNCSKQNRDEINSLLELTEKYPTQYDSYKITHKNSTGIEENLGGSVSLNDVVKAIMSGEDDWSSFIYDSYFDFDESWHEYGPTDFIDSVVYSNGSVDFIDFSPRNNKMSNDEDFDFNFNNSPFFQVASSFEKGNWIYEEFQLEYEFDPECLGVNYSIECPEIISSYNYINIVTGEEVDAIEGELGDSSTSDTDISLYINSDGNRQEIYDFEDLKEQMENDSIDNQDEESIRKFLIEKYKIENENH